MARRRVNVKFLLIALGCVLGVVGVAMGVFYVFPHHGTATKQVATGKQQMAERNYADAIRSFSEAVRIDPKNPELFVLLGDAYRAQSYFDESCAKKMMKGYDDALSLDPNNLDALQKKMSVYVDFVQAHHDVPDCKSLEQISLQITALHPQDPVLAQQAEAYAHIAPLAAWLMGFIAPEDEVHRNMDALSALMNKENSNPNVPNYNPDVPYYLARSYVTLAMEKRRLGQEAEANETFRKAVNVMDQARAAQPSNAVLLVRYYQILLDANAKTADETSPPDLQYVPRMKEVLQGARDIVDKQQANFAANPRAAAALSDQEKSAISDVFLDSAEFAYTFPDAGGGKDMAIKYLRHLLEVRPDVQRARLMLAKLLSLDASTRQEAIDLLEKKITDEGTPGIGLYSNRQNLELNTIGNLIDILISQYSSTTDPAAQKAMLDKINDNYTTIHGQLGDRSDTLKLLGRIKMLTPKMESAIEAVKVLVDAENHERDEHPGETVRDPSLDELLARAYWKAGQSGNAIRYFHKLCKDDNVPVPPNDRLVYARLLLEQHDFPGVADQLAELKKIAPNDPAVMQLEIDELRTMDPSDPKITKLIEKMVGSEVGGSKQQLLSMAGVLLSIGKTDEAQNILEGMVKKTPADIDVVHAMAVFYLSQKQKDKAVAVIADAIKAAPDEQAKASLKYLQMMVEGASDEEKDKAERAALDAIKDPFSKAIGLYKFEMKQAQLAQAKNHADEVNARIAEARKQLDEAQKNKPDNKNANTEYWAYRFEFTMMIHDWPGAQAAVKSLGDLNVDEANGLIYQFKLYMAQGDYQQAANTARTLVHNLPEFSNSHLCMGQAYEALKQYNEAIGEFQTAIASQQNLDAYKGLIECEYILKQPIESLHYIEAGLKASPNHPYFIEQKILYYLNYGHPQEAVPLRRQQWTDAQDQPDAWLNLVAALYQVAQVDRNPPTSSQKEQECNSSLVEAHKLLTDALGKFPDDFRFYAYQAELAWFEHDYAAGQKAFATLALRPMYKDNPGTYVTIGDYDMRIGKTADAETAYKTALDKAALKKDAGVIAEAEVKLAVFYCQQSKFDDALKVLDPESKDRRVVLQRIQTLVVANKAKDADLLLQKLVAENPHDAQFLTLQGQIFIGENDANKAMASLSRALEIEPNNAEALYYRGTIFLYSSEPQVQRAIDDLTKSRDLNPNNPEVHVRLAEALRRQGNLDAVVHELEAAVQLIPGNKMLRMSLVEAYRAQTPPRYIEARKVIQDAEGIEGWKTDPDWRRAEAMICGDMGLYTRALDKIKEATDLNNQSQNKEHAAQLGRILVRDQVNFLQKAKKWGDLEDQCDIDFKLPGAGDQWWIYQARGVARYHRNKKDDALQDFGIAMDLAAKQHDSDSMMLVVLSIEDSFGTDEAIRRLRPMSLNDAHWTVMIAYLYARKGDFPNAVANIEKALNNAQLQGPALDTAQDVAGEIYLMAGEYQEAVDVDLRILKDHPDDLAANNNVAALFSDLIVPPDLARAKAYSDKAMELMKKTNVRIPGVLDTQGWILGRSNDLDGGIALIKESLTLQPQAVELYHLGELEMRKDDPVSAVKHLQTAKKMLDDAKNPNAADKDLELKITRSLESAHGLAGPSQGNN